MDTVIDVIAGARRGLEGGGSLPVARLARLSGQLLRADGAVDWQARCHLDAQGRPALSLRLAGVLPLRCDRCGLPLELPLAAEREFYFVLSERELAAIPVDDAPEEPLLASTHFDLATLIEDEVILQLPLSPRHADCQPGDAPAGEPESAGERRQPFAQLAGLRAQMRDGASAPPKGSGRKRG